MKVTAIILITLSACALRHTTTLEEQQSTAAPPSLALGRVVQSMDPRIWVIHQDRNGAYWFGSNGNGVYRYDGQRLIQFTTKDGLAGHQVRDIEEDTAGNVFISTTKGISRFDGEQLTKLELVESQAGHNGWVLDPDDVWIVFDPGSYGVVRYDGKKLYHLKLPKSPTEDEHRDRFADAPGFFSPSSIYSIYRDRRGHLWFGTAALGICRFDGETHSWMYEEQLTTTPSGGAFGIRCVYEDSSGDYWICNTRHRFQMSREAKLKDGYRHIQYQKKRGLPDAESDTGKNFTFYPSMTEDAAGALWMACGSRVLKHSGNEVSHYHLVDGAYAACIYHDRDGKIWVTTIEHGVYVFENGRFESFRLPGDS